VVSLGWGSIALSANRVTLYTAAFAIIAIRWRLITCNHLPWRELCRLWTVRLAAYADWRVTIKRNASGMTTVRCWRQPAERAVTSCRHWLPATARSAGSTSAAAMGAQITASNGGGINGGMFPAVPSRTWLFMAKQQRIVATGCSTCYRPGGNAGGQRAVSIWYGKTCWRWRTKRWHSSAANRRVSFGCFADA